MDWKCVLVIIVFIAVILSVPRIGSGSRSHKRMTRAETEKWMRDNGYLPRTPEEAADEAERERIARVRFGGIPDNAYCDKNWYLHDIDTDKLIPW